MDPSVTTSDKRLSPTDVASSSMSHTPVAQKSPSPKTRPQPVASSSSNSVPSSSSSNSRLASMLADALSEIESLKTTLQSERQRASYFESLASSLQSVQSSSSRPNTQSEAITAKIAELEKRAYDAQVRCDEEMARRLAVADQWKALSRYLDRIDSVSKDARVRMDHMLDSGLVSGERPFVALHVPTFDDIPYEGPAYNHLGLPMPNRVRRRSDSMEGHPPPSKRLRSDLQGGYHYTIDRTRLPVYMYVPPGMQTTSPDTLSPNSPYSHRQNPSRPPSAHPHPNSYPPPHHHPEPRSHSRRHEPPPQTHTSQNQIHSHPSSHRGGHSPPLLPPQNRSQQPQRPRSPSRSRSNDSSHSLDVDEMLLQATSGPGDSPQTQRPLRISASTSSVYPPTSASNSRDVARSRSHSSLITHDALQHRHGLQYPLPPPPSAMSPPGSTSGPGRHPSHSPIIRRDRERERDRERGRDEARTLVPADGPGWVSYSHGDESSQRRDRERERSNSPKGRDGNGHGKEYQPQQSQQVQQVQLQTHTFVPVQTGAPVKKKYTHNTPLNVVSEGELYLRLCSSTPFLFVVKLRLELLFVISLEYPWFFPISFQSPIETLSRRSQGRCYRRNQTASAGGDDSQILNPLSFLPCFLPSESFCPDDFACADPLGLVLPLPHNTHNIPIVNLDSHSSLNTSNSHSSAIPGTNALPDPIDPTQPFSPYPATNVSGQRICRQCGQVGRYKENKCIEKWGPGPMGPGTVCDRCRKKMKRVEKRLGAQAAQVKAWEASKGHYERERSSRENGRERGGGTWDRDGDEDGEGGKVEVFRTDTIVVGPAGQPRYDIDAKLDRLTSVSSSRGGSRRVSPGVGGKGNHLAPARMVHPPPSTGTRKLASYSASNGCGHRVMVIDVDEDGDADGDGDGDGEVDELELDSEIANVEEEEDVDGELADLVGEKPELDVDTAVSQLAGMDDHDEDGHGSEEGVSRHIDGEDEVEADADLLDAIDAAEAHSSGSLD
ncbi:hypothetical protein D9758_018349 [Tetrapyrgos nigripes]|uniref:Uncharacterized protein n=1 Tax=Tetrapyrgos nigripes TaxID=182062 RepID=A0A8H5BK84_9AGAR|nr:hypothetical protein D9758_018349 [Tetrapyrgos nigripes]